MPGTRMFSFCVYEPTARILDRIPPGKRSQAINKALQDAFSADELPFLGPEKEWNLEERLYVLKAVFEDSPFTYHMAKDALGISLAHAKRVINELVDNKQVFKLDETLQRAHQFIIWAK